MDVKGSEVVGVMASIDPSVQAVGTLSTAWVSAADSHRLLALILIGALGAAATVDAKLQQATDGAGAGAKDITGAAVVQHTTTSGKQLLINAKAEDLDVNGGFSYVRLSVTVATAATATAAVLTTIKPRNVPIPQNANVTQVIG